MQVLHKDVSIDTVDFLKGSSILIDKPKTWTSFDVVNKVRYSLRSRLQVKKIKVGHAGTLDPLATGLLLVNTGKATKRIEEIQGQPKTYKAQIKLGATTKSYDAETPEENHRSIDYLTPEMIDEVLRSFVGEIDQTPPIFSALKVKGKPLYKYARENEEVRIKSRKVQIYSIERLALDLPFLEINVHCGKGTYIRSLAHDVGVKLGCGAYLSDLVRTKIGDYSLSDAWNLDELVEGLK